MPRYKDFVSLSLAYFLWLFGAGNLIYPLVVGRNSGKYVFLVFLVLF